jgi:enoyl-CoA hydratase/carnithine racemase
MVGTAIVWSVGQLLPHFFILRLAFGQAKPAAVVIVNARLIGRGRALEAILSGADYSADLADSYGWINRALPAAELGELVSSLAHRIASFLPPPLP